MKFLILNTDYPEFLSWLYSQHPALENDSYEAQLQARIESLFGVADFYSSNLRKLGHEAWDIHANNEFMQKAWAREQGIPVDEPSRSMQLVLTRVQQARQKTRGTWLRRLKPIVNPILIWSNRKNRWFYDILAKQIENYQPDVLLNQAMDGISSQFLRRMKSHFRLLVGQIAASLPQNEDFRCYDLVISSLPNFVNHFRRMGIPSELSRLAFEPRVREKLEEVEKCIPISFVGSLFSVHRARILLLEYLCKKVPLRVWGQGVESLILDSPIREHYMGRAWGIEMYQILQKSKITLNHHGDISESYANNMRLFEATGIGTLLITDWKENLHEMFRLGEEVVAYHKPEECAELIQYYLEHEDEQKAIARAGQERTLRDHTYLQRMQELVALLHEYL